jgi:hypothetical protein
MAVGLPLRSEPAIGATDFMYAARLPAISTPRKGCYALAARIGKPASRWIDVVQSGRSLKGYLYARFFGAALRFRPQPGIDVGLDARGPDLGNPAS